MFCRGYREAHLFILGIAYSCIQSCGDTFIHPLQQTFVIETQLYYLYTNSKQIELIANFFENNVLLAVFMKPV